MPGKFMNIHNRLSASLHMNTEFSSSSATTSKLKSAIGNGGLIFRVSE